MMRYWNWLVYTLFNRNAGLDIIVERLRDKPNHYVALWDSRLEAIHWFSGTGNLDPESYTDQPFDIRVTTAYIRGDNVNNVDLVVSPDLIHRLKQVNNNGLLGLTTLHINYPIQMVLSYLRQLSCKLRRDQLYPVGQFYVGSDIGYPFTNDGMIKFYNQSHKVVRIPMELIGSDFLITDNPMIPDVKISKVVAYNRGMAKA